MKEFYSKEKPPIEVSDARPDDVEGIQMVFYKTWLATYPNEEAGITVDDIEDRYKDILSEERLERRRNDIEHHLPNERFIVARDTGKVIGICRTIRREDANQLQAIYVLPEYQGKGVGGSLWKEAQTFLDTTKDTFVEVVTYNQNAIDFYLRLGFEDTGRRISNEKFKLKSGAIMPEMEMKLGGEPSLTKAD